MLIRFYKSRYKGTVAFDWKFGVSFSKLIDGSGYDRHLGRGNYPYVWQVALLIGFWSFRVTMLPYVDRNKFKESLMSLGKNLRSVSND